MTERPPNDAEPSRGGGPAEPEGERPARMNPAGAGMAMLSVNILCTAVGAGIGALLGALIPFALAGFFAGFFAGIAFVAKRF